MGDYTIRFDVCEFLRPEDRCKNADGFTYSALDKEDYDAGIMVNYTAPSGYNANNTRYQLSLALRCRKEANADPDNPDFNDGDDQIDIKDIIINYETANETVDGATVEKETVIFTIVAETQNACPLFSLGQFEDFIEQNKFIFIVVFGVIGLFECFLGQKNV